MPRFTDETNNNLIERLQGTVRERDKAVRGFKKEDSARKFLPTTPSPPVEKPFGTEMSAVWAKSDIPGSIGIGP